LSSWNVAICCSLPVIHVLQHNLDDQK
jgi:hypothetical protein